MSSKQLVNILTRLSDQGALPASQLSEPCRLALQPLFDTEVLTEQRKGRGCSIRVNHPEAFAAFITKQYPEGLSEIGTGRMSRSEGVAKLRDSKYGQLTSEVVMVWAKPGQRLVRNSEILPVGQLTELAQVASFVLGESEPAYWQFAGRIALVENLACFMNWQQMGVLADMGIYAAGRSSDRLIKWCASPALAQCSFVHCGDYDPVGLDEFLRLSRALSQGRVMLFVPDNIDRLFERYANPTLLANPQAAALLNRLRLSTHPDVSRIVSLMNRHNGGLEQEILLKPASRGIK